MKPIVGFGILLVALAILLMPGALAAANITEMAAESGINETALRMDIENITEKLGYEPTVELIEPGEEISMTYPLDSDWGFSETYDAYERLPKDPAWGYETYGLPLTNPVILFRFYNDILEQSTAVLFNNETMETVLFSDTEIIDFCVKNRGRDNVTVGNSIVLSSIDLESMSEDII